MRRKDRLVTYWYWRRVLLLSALLGVFAYGFDHLVIVLWGPDGGALTILPLAAIGAVVGWWCASRGWLYRMEWVGSRDKQVQRLDTWQLSERMAAAHESARDAGLAIDELARAFKAVQSKEGEDDRSTAG